jgi:small subunit ribosomal protein S24e
VEKDFDNKMLKRREMLVSLEFEGATPSREEIKRSLADKFNLKRENIVVVRTGQLYGTKKGSVLIHEYYDKEAMKIAQKHTIARPNPKKGAAAEAPKQEAAPQEKKEEKKAEEAK